MRTLNRYLVACILLVFSTSCIADDNKIMPESLINIAQQNNCEQISDFYENTPGPIDPPFVWINHHNVETNLFAVFWCRAFENKSLYKLIVWENESESKRNIACNPIIEWKNRPGGLMVFEKQDIKLSDFRYLEKPKTQGPSSVKTEGYLIQSRYDGVGVDFYCYDRQWLFRRVH